MSVVSVLEINNGRGGEGNVTQTKSWRTYTRVFRVITNSGLDDTVVVAAGVQVAYGIWPGAPYPNDFSAWCTKLVARPETEKSKYRWLATASYTSEWQPQQNPLTDPAIIEWSTAPYQRPYTMDINQQGITNSAGDSFYNPVMGDDSRWEVRVQKNLAFVPQWIMQFKDAVNSSAFTVDGVAVGQYQGKCSAIGVGKWQTRNNLSFRVLSYTLHLDFNTTDGSGNPCGWIKQVLDEGLRQLKNFGGYVQVPCRDNQSHRVTSPVLLNGSGVQIANPTPTSAKYLPFHIYKEVDFNQLPLS